MPLLGELLLLSPLLYARSRPSGMTVMTKKQPKKWLAQEGACCSLPHDGDDVGAIVVDGKIGGKKKELFW